MCWGAAGFHSENTHEIAAASEYLLAPQALGGNALTFLENTLISYSVGYREISLRSLTGLLNENIKISLQGNNIQTLSNNFCTWHFWESKSVERDAYSCALDETAFPYRQISCYFCLVHFISQCEHTLNFYVRAQVSPIATSTRKKKVL